MPNKTLLYTDVAQVDKIVFYYKKLVNSLREEIIQLKNRPVAEVQRNIIQVVSSRRSVDLNNPVDQWSPSHFLKFFLQKYREKYKGNINFSSDDWKANSLKVHYFLERHKDELSKEDYKKMIEWLFKKVFDKTFVPTVGNLASDWHFYQWRDSGQMNKRKDSSSSPKKRNGASPEALIKYFSETE